MFRRHLFSSLLTGVAFLAAGNSVQAGAPCASAAPGAPAATVAATPGTTTQTITVMEMVPETYETTRTVFRTEYVNEKYTAYRTISVPETRLVTRHVTRLVPEFRDVVRTTYKCVPTMETRTVMKQIVTCKPVTTIVRKCVDMGHYECCQVPARVGLLDRVRKCCDPCYEPCQKFVTKKVWVPNKVWVEKPVTKMVRCVECVPSTVQVCVNRLVACNETVRVCTHKCVTDTVQEKCTVHVCKSEPYEATRCVARCVPHVEKVACTRLVCKPVVKTVTVSACQPCCPPPCCTVKHSRCCR